MKRLLVMAIITMLAFTACAAADTEHNIARDSKNDPIFNESAAFNNINDPVSSDFAADSNQTPSEASMPTQNASDAYKKFASALLAAEKLNAYKLQATGAVAVEIDKTSVELEKITAKYSVCSNGNFTVESQTDLKDNHNSSVSQLLESVYGDKSIGKMHTRSEFSSFVSSGDDYLDIRRTSYKLPNFSRVIGAAYSFKSSDVESVTSAEIDGAVTIKFMFKPTVSAAFVRTELSNAGITSKQSDIDVEHFILTAVIDTDGVLAACGISSRVSALGTDYTINRELSLSDKNSTAFYCIKPDWV